MDRKHTLLIGGAILVSLGMLLYVGFRSATFQEVSVPPPTSVGASTTAPIETIVTAKHAYVEHKHILVGEISLPTPCHLLEYTTTITPGDTRATIAFVRKFEGGECPGGEIAGRFKVVIPASATTTLQATLDGRLVRLNLIEVSPQDIENSDIYIKG